jgi:transposase
MIALPSGIPVIVVHEPVSFGRGIDGMRGLCKLLTDRDPLDSGYFLFINRRRNQARIIWYDGQGFLLCTKRLSTGRFLNWPKYGESVYSIVEYFQAQGLLCDGNPHEKNFHPVWRK